MISIEIRIKNFLDSVALVADEQKQVNMWVDGKAVDSFVVSLGELYAQFFDDNDIDNFIANELDGASLSSGQCAAIRAFRDAMNAFSKAPGKPANFADDAFLLSDPEWKKLVEIAKSTIAEFKNIHY